MTLHVLIETNSNGFLLVKLLQEEQRAGLIEIRCSAPPSSLYGAARALLVVRNEPVAAVLDAGSTAPEAAERRRQGAEEVIGEAAGAAPLRILVAVPALEALLFRRSGAIARAYAHIPPATLEVGAVSPRDGFVRLDATSSGEQVSLKIVNALDDADVAALRAESPIRELLEFLGELQRDGVLAAAGS